MKSDSDVRAKIRGILLGTAVGDALGLPMEGLSAERIRKRGWAGELNHRLFFGRSFVSDDTEHTFFVTQALLASVGDHARFKRELAKRLRWWFACIPAGVGLGTALSCLKLWLGFGVERSGTRSAGNGPAMRCAIIGARFAEDAELRRLHVEASTQLTHRDPRALIGAMAVAELAAAEVRGEDVPGGALALLHALGEGDEDWRNLVDQMDDALACQAEVSDYAKEIGCAKGVSGYVYQSVPVAIYAYLRHYGEFRTIITEVIACGGDTDTVAAIAGALAGASGGSGDDVEVLAKGIVDWPLGWEKMRGAADNLASLVEGGPAECACWSWWAVPFRNVLFLAIVLGHGILRIVR